MVEKQKLMREMQQNETLENRANTRCGIHICKNKYEKKINVLESINNS